MPVIRRFEGPACPNGCKGVARSGDSEWRCHTCKVNAVQVEYVVLRAADYEGAVSPNPELLAFVRDFADWHTTADLNALAPRARDLLDRFGGQSETPPASDENQDGGTDG